MVKFNDTKFDHGDLVKDIITGFEGVVIAKTHYSTGCLHYALSARRIKEDGTKFDWLWFDETRLVLVRKDEVTFGIRETKATSGPFPNAPEN